jgi:hypothetical protein
MAAVVPSGTDFGKNGDVWHSKFPRSAVFARMIPNLYFVTCVKKPFLASCPIRLTFCAVTSPSTLTIRTLLFNFPPAVGRH